MLAVKNEKLTVRRLASKFELSPFLPHVSHFPPLTSSLKDDDSGDHDQDQGSPKDSEKEKTEDEEKEQNTSKKKVLTF